MFCTSCGNKLEDGARFCDQCGKQLAAPENKQPSIPAPVAQKPAQAEPVLISTMGRPAPSREVSAPPVADRQFIPPAQQTPAQGNWQAVPNRQVVPPARQAPAQNTGRQQMPNQWPAPPTRPTPPPKKKRRWWLIILCIVLGLSFVASLAYFVITIIVDGGFDDFSLDSLFDRGGSYAGYYQPTFDNNRNTVPTEAPTAVPTEAPTYATDAPIDNSWDEPLDEDISADDIPDVMESADGTYEVAFVTDVGQLKDKSFNQGTYDGVKLFAYKNGLSYKYYQPANGDAATDDDRINAMKAAAENGAKVVVATGFMQGTALAAAAAKYPEVKFVFIDGWSLGVENVAAIVFREEQCCYLAGYAAVKEGYTKLGFTGGGGGTNDACCRYGYGYVQGANAAAAELGITVDMNYTWLYGAAFSPSADLQTLCSDWYAAGTEVIFSCGGAIFYSVTAAAAANDCDVIGVDVDQSFQSDTVITSALKRVDVAAYQALEAAYGLNGADWWDGWGNNCKTLGAKEGAVGLPTATWSLTGWTVEEYEDLLDDIADGYVYVDADFANLGTNTPNVNLTIFE